MASRKSGSASSNVSRSNNSSITPPSSGKRVSGRPSDKLNMKTIDPFHEPTKGQSAFAAVYGNGGIPCRLVHGSVNHRLVWTIPPGDVPMDPVLITLAEGIQETVHPYTFVARVGFKELLQVSGCQVTVVSLLPRLAPSLRSALGNSDATVCKAGLDALGQLSQVVGAALNKHLKALLGPLCKKTMDRKLKEPILAVLQLLEQNGGKDALQIIKSKVPTYSSLFS